MAVHTFVLTSRPTAQEWTRAIPEIFSIRNSRMGVILVAPPHGYPQQALPAGPSQETHLLASSDVVDKEPEWKAG